MENPLVSILIPANGNPVYLEVALTSVLLQTYTNIEVIIRDPSTTDEIQVLLEKDFLPYSKKIKYMKDNKYTPPIKIFQELLDLSQGKYVNFLMEKDLFYPTKIKNMMTHFLKDKTNSLKLITSNRESINQQGDLILNPINTNYQNLYFDGRIAGNLLLKKPTYLGGISSYLFRKEDLVPSFGYLDGYLFRTEMVIPTWLNLLSKGSCLLLAEHLTFERDNSPVISQENEIHLINEWITLISLAKNQGFLNTSSDLGIVINRVSKQINDLILYKPHIFKKEERELLYEYKKQLCILKSID